MDFIDNPAESILTAVFEVPGIKTNDISLHISNGHLVLSGERRPTYNTTQQSEALPQDTSVNNNRAPRLTVPIQELRFGRFRRAIRIPEDIKVKSSFLILHAHSQFFSSLSFRNRLTRFFLYRNQTSMLASTKVC